MKLFGYWRSSAAYRVRIALNLKQLSCEHQSVHLVKNGGEQHQSDYQTLNPNELVPTLVDGDFKLNQSMAILEYLEQKYPETALLPKTLEQQMLCRAIALDIACEIHPLNNLRVLQHLAAELQQDEQGKVDWMLHWLQVGFTSLEKSLTTTSGLCCFGDSPTWADICLVPQVYNAERFKLDMTPYPQIVKIVKYCRSLPAFIDAAPENQYDAVR
ncbi:maleylacetoacetate isomerase [Psychrosphaera saromensis]|uniref:Maleylacetoacetate isomerase n=1 Tax=Psychrosphaera saromensis TaxID=716813 RepID=A0A2S7UWU5_9GAMM|nr:maleylacetoacetate isomerase [Psychrosphaera saromensis]PQJ54423.1 maleylacetoacetate isomerase [Psychrosphaera saromensis]GHB60076.1 maleylacetoacetate isomerase [Psychrosphaera saromensis]GLQ14383.1 maleylacetoacetate isomerase [Psychrosphaera saromensis]